MPHARPSPWLLVLLAALGVGCGRQVSTARPREAVTTTQAAATTRAAAAGEASGADPGAPWGGLAGEELLLDEVAPGRELVRGLALELELEPERAARMEQAVEVAWADVREEVQRRVAAGEDVQGEALTDLLEERQRLLDQELSALLTPPQRAAFEALTGAEEQAR